MDDQQELLESSNKSREQLKHSDSSTPSKRSSTPTNGNNRGGDTDPSAFLTGFELTPKLKAYIQVDESIDEMEEIEFNKVNRLTK